MIYPGLEIGDYVIKDELGRGGFGSVYIAEDKNTGKEVAIKFLHPNALKSSDSKQNFVDEMINQARLSTNPNIVQIIRSISYKDKQGEHLGMVMEYIDGDPLDIYIHKFGLLPDFIAIPIFLQVLNGLSFAHEFNMLHRDIKPANIIVSKDGVVKIMDFGLAKVLSSYAAEESARAASLNYVSPERLQRKNIDRRTDVYSLGATFYEALTGRALYDIEAGNWDDALKKHLSGNFKPIRSFYEGHSEFLESIISKTVDPDLNRRYSDCEEIISDFKKLWEETTLPDSIKSEFKVVIDRTDEIFSDKTSANANSASNNSNTASKNILNQFTAGGGGGGGGEQRMPEQSSFSNPNVGIAVASAPSDGNTIGTKIDTMINKVTSIKTENIKKTVGLAGKAGYDQSLNVVGKAIVQLDKFRNFIINKGLKGEFMIIGISWIVLFILNLLFREPSNFRYMYYRYHYESYFVSAFVLSIPTSISLKIFFNKIELKFWKIYLFNFIGFIGGAVIIIEIFRLGMSIGIFAILFSLLLGIAQFLLIRTKFKNSFLWIFSTTISYFVALAVIRILIHEIDARILAYLEFDFIFFLLTQLFFARVFMKKLYKEN